MPRAGVEPRSAGSILLCSQSCTVHYRGEWASQESNLALSI